MSYDLQLRKGGLLITNEWDSDIRDYLEQIVDNDELIFYLYDTICLDRNINLRDIFLMISRNIEAFVSAIGCPFLEDLVKEGLSPRISNRKKDDMGHLELGRSASFSEGKLYLYTDFCGKGLEETWAIEFSPINELSFYPIVINEKVIVEDDSGNNVFQFNMPFTLLDFVKGIIDELSFVGPPDVKSLALKELKNRAESAVSGKGCDLEEIKEKLEDRKNRYKITCIVCGKDARSPHFHKPPTMCYECFRKTKEN